MMVRIYARQHASVKVAPPALYANLLFLCERSKATPQSDAGLAISPGHGRCLYPVMPATSGVHSPRDSTPNFPASPAPTTSPPVILSIHANSPSPSPTKRTVIGDNIPLLRAERMLYHQLAGEKSVPFDQVPSVHGHPISIQVANGLRSGLPPATLIGVVSSATGPATARHALGPCPSPWAMRAKNPSANPPAVGLITARNLVNTLQKIACTP